MGERPYPAPDPEEAADLAEFVGLLGELRARAGMVPYRSLAKRVGPLMRPVRVVAPSTVVDVFKARRRRLDLDLVVAIVRALGADEPTVGRWREACLRVHRQAKSGGPVGVFGQLPADLATFTGRHEELRRLTEAATAARRDGDGATTVVISAIEGMAGIGKTQLAVHAAHRLVRDGHFADTQLHVNLRGFDPDLPPAEPAAVLEVFLRQLGVPAQQIPESRDERAAMYRDRMRDRSALVLLDNAADEDQVRDLIPSAPSCLVLITSRRSLAGLDGVTPHLLDTFSPDESLDLLVRIAGRERVAAEPGAAARIVGYCDHLPLAVALAAARLRSRPAWPLGRLADELETGRLDAIRAGSRGIRPVFDLSYRALPGPAQRVFRLLALHPGPEMSADAAAALTGHTVTEAARILELLVDENMVQQRCPGRYELHDLLRAHAIELRTSDGRDACRDDREDARDGEDEGEAAVVRGTAWYAHGARNARAALGKDDERPAGPCAGRPYETDPARFDSDTAAQAWLAAEETNLEHAMRAAAASGLHDIAWHLSRCLDTHYFQSGRITDALRVNLLGAQSAHDAGNPSCEGRSLSAACWAYIELGALADAESCQRRALELCESTGDLHGKAVALNSLGKISSDRGRHSAAIDFYQASLAIHAQLGELRHVGYAYCNIGVTHFEAKRYDLALAGYLESLKILDSPDQDSFALVLLLSNIAEIQLLTGAYADALGHQTRCLSLARANGYHLQEAMALLALGDIHAGLGDPAEAHAAWTASAAAYDRLGDLEAAAGARARLTPPPAGARPSRA